MKQRLLITRLTAAFAILLLSALPVFSQGAAKHRTVTGLVSNQNGDPVVGAMVVISGTQTGTATDLEGKYSINVNTQNAVLEISSIGYETQIVHVVVAVCDNDAFV